MRVRAIRRSESDERVSWREAVRERGVETVLFSFAASEAVAMPAVLEDHLSSVLSRQGVASRSSLRILAQRASLLVSSVSSCFRLEPVRELERSDRRLYRVFQRPRAVFSAVFHVSEVVVEVSPFGRVFIDIKAFWSLMRILRKESKVFYNTP